MGLQDRDYYGEKYWKLIEEEDKKPTQPPRIEKIHRPDFWFRKRNLIKRWFQFLRAFQTIIVLACLIFALIYFLTSKFQKFKSPDTQFEKIHWLPKERENIWRIGETIQRGDFEYTLNWVKIFPVWVYSREETNYPKETYYYKYVPKENFKFVMLNLTAKNIGIKKSSPEDFEMKVKSVEGYLYEGIEGTGYERATFQEAQNYFCKRLSRYESIYPEEKLEGCEAITIHQNREPAEIIIKFSPYSYAQQCFEYLFDKEKFEKCKREIEVKNTYLIQIK